MRLFSIVQWHHFAYMIIGLALLGYGFSGTITTLFQQTLLRHFYSCYTISVALFAVSGLYSFRIAQSLPFHAEMILWDPLQLWILASLFLLLSIPFFFAASAICLALMHAGNLAGRIYAVDLAGAGVGSITILILLFWLFPEKILLVISLTALLSAFFPLRGVKRIQQVRLSAILAISAAAIAAGGSPALKISPYKQLSQILQIDGSQIIEQRSSPLGLLTVVKNDGIPFRLAPGLSLNAIQEPLPQLALFSDGHSMSPITRYPESLEMLGYLDHMSSALPYHLKDLDHVLIAGGSGGADVLQALLHKVERVDVLEINPDVINLVNESANQFSGALYKHQNVQWHIGEVREHLNRNTDSYQLIQFTLTGASDAASAGLHALHENYLLTHEAISLYLQRIESNGYLAFTRWVSLPPRDTLRLLHTIAEALRGLGVSDVSKRIALIRSWQTCTLLVKNGEFSNEELQKIRDFSEQRSFDLAWLPNLREEDANRFNKLSSPVFYNASRSLFSDSRDRFIQQYKFDISASSDNRPYFYHTLKWKTFRELYRLRDQGAMPLLEWGYILLLFTLLIAMFLSALLIVLPLYFLNRTQNHGSSRSSGKVFSYFFSLGLAYIIIEISYIQKFLLFLHHPIYTIAITVAAFLVFSGMGSYYSNRCNSDHARIKILKLSVLCILITGLSYLVVLDPLFAYLADSHIVLKVIFSVALIAPLAFFMGMPFPLAVNSLAEHSRMMVPWAWGINGCASVISASLATIIAMSFGFIAAVLIASGFYLFTSATFPAVATFKNCSDH